MRHVWPRIYAWPGHESWCCGGSTTTLNICTQRFIPLVEIVDARSFLGRWYGGERRYAVIAHSHIEEDPWLDVLDTLRHEMAHQYVDEVLAISGEPPHGPAFRRACEKLRCSPRARGVSATGKLTAEDRLLQRLRKVLSLAESPNDMKQRSQ